jgi:hypothetical protein
MWVETQQHPESGLARPTFFLRAHCRTAADHDPWLAQRNPASLPVIDPSRLTRVSSNKLSFSQWILPLSVLIVIFMILIHLRDKTSKSLRPLRASSKSPINSGLNRSNFDPQ